MLKCEILISEAEIKAIAGEWRQLHSHAGNSPFTDYDWFDTWWRIIGNSGRQMPHVVIGREGEKLAAVLPLTVARRAGLRVLRAAGHKSFYYCDMVCEDSAQAAELWQAARSSPYYDFADIRDVYPESACYKALSSFAHKRDVIEAFFLRFKEHTGNEWLSSLSGNLRGNFKRCTRRLEEKGPLHYHVHRAGPPSIEAVDNFVKDKVSWCIQHHKPGLFGHSDVHAYFREMTRISAQQGRLFLAWLQCGEEFVAYQLGFIHHNVLHMPFWAYGEAWAQYSPGSVIMVNTIQWAIDQGLQGMDLRQGKNSFKLRYANETRDCVEFTFSGSPHGRLLESTFITLRNAKRMLQSNNDNTED